MRRHILIVATGSHIPPQLLAGAVTAAMRRTPDAVMVVNVMIPAVLPPTLPVTAWPPRLAARLNRLHDAVEPVLESLQPKGRVEIVPCRSVAALLQAVWPVDRLVVVGRAGWSVRRAARGVAPDVVMVPDRSTPGRRDPAPAAQPQAIAERP
jgi:hypothetical protein